MLPLVCLDVDGTLVGRAGAPTEAVWAAAAAATSAGIRLAMCTARLAAGPTPGFARRLDAAGWHVFHAGAALWRPGSDEVITHPLDRDAVGATVEEGARRGWVTEAYTWDDYAVDSDAPWAVEHAGLLGLEHRRRPLDDLGGDVVRVQWLVPADGADEALRAAPAGSRASAARTPTMPEVALVSLTAAQVSKVAGIREVAADLGVDLGQVMMVGDAANDIEAMQAVGHGVAMGNAEAPVQAAADHVVASVEADGVIEALGLAHLLDASGPGSSR